MFPYMGAVTSTRVENGENDICRRRNKHWFMWIRQFKTIIVINIIMIMIMIMIIIKQ